MHLLFRLPGVKVNEVQIHCIRFADDIALAGGIGEEYEYNTY